MVDPKPKRTGILAALALALGCSSAADAGAGYMGVLCGHVETDQQTRTDEGCAVLDARDGAILTPLWADACDSRRRGHELPGGHAGRRLAGMGSSRPPRARTGRST